MRRQRKVNSLRRHYNESTANAGGRVHWASAEPRISSPLSYASKRKPGVRTIGVWHRTSPASRTASPLSVQSRPDTQERRDSVAFEPSKALTRVPTGLCSKCFEIALHHFQNDAAKVQYHRNFIELVNSAKTCVLCFIFAKQAPVPSPNANFTYDRSRQVVLSATHRRTEINHGTPGLTLDKLVVHLPVTRRDDQRAVSLPTQAHLVAGRDSQAASTGDVVGRRCYGGTNIICAVNWLAECVMKHNECRKSTDLVGSLMYAVPPRLLDIGCHDTSTMRLVETDHNFISPYVALTYARGEAKVYSTNLANLRTRQEGIGIEKFNKTFKQAITVTRLLGFRYLWIDAYCIVMDWPEDRTKHVPRMGMVYHNAALTLSAAVSESADDGLVRYKPKTSPEAKIPYRTKDGVPLGHLFVTSYKARGFTDDILGGCLNERAWCLQARALSRRILHFGHDQLFWECDAGLWAEDSALKYPADVMNDPMVEWRAGFLRHKRGIDDDGRQLVPASKTGRPNSAALVIPKIYQLWYQIVAQYTNRTLPREKDKSSAVAGLAYIFACLISQRQTHVGTTKPRADQYIAGLWQNDLPYGLLWSSGSFHKWRMKFAKYPSHPRAPSWSWLSVDGPLHWPDGVVFSSGSFTGRSFMKVLSVGSHYDRRTDHDFSTLRVRGKVALLSRLYGFRPEDTEWKRTARDQDLANHNGSHDQAEGPINIPCALFDSSEVARVWMTLHGSNTDRPSTGSSSADQPSISTRSGTGIIGGGGGIFGRSSHRSRTSKKPPTTTAQPNLIHDQQKDFIALLVIPAGCSQAECTEHSFGVDKKRLSNTIKLSGDTAFRAKSNNNCGQGLAYALILYPSSMGEGLFRRVGIAQVRIADFATVERRRDREVVIV